MKITQIKKLIREVTELTIEEAEALRLRNIKDLKQIVCAKLMKTSLCHSQKKP